VESPQNTAPLMWSQLPGSQHKQGDLLQLHSPYESNTRAGEVILRDSTTYLIGQHPCNLQMPGPCAGIEPVCSLLTV